MNTPEAAVESSDSFRPSVTVRWGGFTLFSLFFMSLLTHIDHSILSAVLPQMIADLKLNATQAGYLPTWVILSLLVVCPIVGYVGDRVKRTRLLVAGIAVWSLATLAMGLCQNHVHLSMTGILLGIGEAIFAVVAPTILMDIFARDRRARVMSLFYLAMPLGAAIGLYFGGTIATGWSWRLAFFIVGAPGSLAAIVALFLPEPTRGMNEGVRPERVQAHLEAGPSREDYIDLMVNSSFTYSVMGMAFFTFAIGGILHWTPTFLVSAKGFEPAFATKWLAVTTLLAAIVGLIAGGVLADVFVKTRPRALFLLPALAMLASVPILIAAIYSIEPTRIFALFFCAQALMFVNIGPCNAILANVVMPNMRAVAYAAAVFASHMIGDLWSGALIGWVADTFSKRDSMASVFGQWLTAIGAVPTFRQGQFPMNLTAGMLVVVPSLVMSGMVLLAGARHLPREMDLMLAKLRARPSRSTSSQGTPFRR